ncbi:hypothetical protein EK21DRAFT_115236 [Setomelanomma holmii]|uniref:Uncharacterized protein n=1 Tax=Setomelanomma holmii TaxID=210430 RepID=A0A9P4H2D1_9PLEO|nr:hypothetical protein EK21DRAFT_115236 [Setomelanomma holmii]
MLTDEMVSEAEGEADSEADALDDDTAEEVADWLSDADDEVIGVLDGTTEFDEDEDEDEIWQTAAPLGPESATMEMLSSMNWACIPSGAAVAYADPCVTILGAGGRTESASFETTVAGVTETTDKVWLTDVLLDIDALLKARVLLVDGVLLDDDVLTEEDIVKLDRPSDEELWAELDEELSIEMSVPENVLDGVEEAADDDVWAFEDVSEDVPEVDRLSVDKL